MPTLTATLSEFILYSKWTATKKADGTLSYSYPTLAKATKTFDLSGIMQGSTVTAAKLEVKHSMQNKQEQKKVQKGAMKL